MKVFISWSGDLSHKVACVFREWLPSVIQAVHPYVSSEDIDKGTRWSTDIAQELDESHYGIICVTNDNLNAPWVSFEAGALSKIIDKSNVSPFLFNIKRSEIQGPLLQFQSTIYEREDVSKLLKSINKRIEDGSRLSDEQLQRAFDVWWPQLDMQLKSISEQPRQSNLEPQHRPKESDILEELLELARSQQRLLSSPEGILPPGYLEHVLSRMPNRRSSSTTHDFDFVHDQILKLRKLLKSQCAEIEDSSQLKEALVLVEAIHRFFHELERFSDESRISRRRLMRDHRLFSDEVSDPIKED